MEAVEARIEAKGGSKWGNFAAAEAKLSSSFDWAGFENLVA